MFHPAFCCVTTIQKVHGTVSGFVQVQRGRRDNTRQKQLLSFQNEHFLYFLTIKHTGLKTEAFSTRRLCE